MVWQWEECEWILEGGPPRRSLHIFVFVVTPSEGRISWLYFLLGVHVCAFLVFVLVNFLSDCNTILWHYFVEGSMHCVLSGFNSCSMKHCAKEPPFNLCLKYLFCSHPFAFEWFLKLRLPLYISGFYHFSLVFLLRSIGICVAPVTRAVASAGTDLQSLCIWLQSCDTDTFTMH